MLLAWFATAAFALPEFPGDVRDAVDMDCTPPCIICHDSPLGGVGTANTAFGTAIREHGVSADAGTLNEEALLAALAGIAADAVDSDGDGTPDVTECDLDQCADGPFGELALGENPNGGTPLCDRPEYGCFSHAPIPAGLLALGFAVGAQAARARRRRGR